MSTTAPPPPPSPAEAPRLAPAVTATPKDVAAIYGTALYRARRRSRRRAWSLAGSWLVYRSSTPAPGPSRAARTASTATSSSTTTSTTSTAYSAETKGLTMSTTPETVTPATDATPTATPTQDGATTTTTTTPAPADLLPGETYAPLAPGQLACAYCGAAQDEPAHVVTRHALVEAPTAPGGQPLPGRGASDSVALKFAVCPTCHAAETQARDLVRAHPVLAQTWGPTVAAERLTSALTALEAVERDVPPLDARSAYSLALMLGVPGRSIAYSLDYGKVASARATVDKAAAERWAHAGGRDRLEVVVNYLVWRRMEAVRDEPPVRVAPPTGPAGCLLCGVAHVEVPAPAVVRYGPKGVARRVWAPRKATVGSLVGRGSAGGATVSGHLCPTCNDVAEDVGTLGITAAERAFAAHLTATGTARSLAAVEDVGTLGITAAERAFAAHLTATGTARSLAAVEDVRAGQAGGAHAWALTDVPAGEPWAHLAEHPAVAR